MNLQNPAALAWLVPAGGLLVALYLLRIRRQKKVVPASFLWPSLHEDVRANTWFQRPKLSWLFVLQLLALAVLGWSLARPQVQDTGLLGSATVFVVDASQSMGATDVKPNRLAGAVEIVRQAVAKMQPADQVAVIEAGANPRVVSALSNDPAQHLAALSSLHVSDTSGRIDEALRLAAALVSADQGGRIVVVSDGCFPPVQDFSPGKAAVVFRQVGEKDDNLSIEALSAADTKEGRLLYAGVHNHGKTSLNATLEIYADMGLIDSSVIRVEPGKTEGKTVGVPSNAKSYQARIRADDLLESDNFASCSAPGRGQVKALLVSSGDTFLERALSLDPRVTLDRAAKLPRDGGKDYDLVVFDGIESTATGVPYVVSFGVTGGPLVTSGAASPATFVSQEVDPLTDGVEFDGLNLGDLPKTRLGEGRSLLETSQGPGLAVSRRAGQTWVACAISPLKSEFPLTVGFPIFIGNVLDVVASRPALDTIVVEAGQSFSLPSKEAVELIDPSGAKQTLKPEGLQVTVREIDKTGVWKLKTPQKEIPVYASSIASNDSDLAPRTTLQLGQVSQGRLAKVVRSADSWKPFLLLCLAVLGLEWWVFVRKS